MTAIEKNLHHDTIGTLLEMALRDQNAIHAAIEQLKNSQKSLDLMTRQLPGEMAQRVDLSLKNSVNSAAEKLISHVSNANIQADIAAKAYQQSSKHSVVKIALMALGIIAIGAALLLFAALTLAPSKSEIQALRDERDDLKRQITLLETKGGRSDITMCKLNDKAGRLRMCAKLDPSFKDVWEGGYLIIANKN